MTPYLRALLALAALLWAPLAAAQTFPKLSGQVVDEAGLLNPAQEQALTAKLAALSAQSGRQLVVATIPDLQGYDISDYGYRLGRAWGIGDKERNDGALLIVAPNDRKVRIEVGYGVEGVLTDAVSSRIIRNDITPRFKAGDFPGGIDAGADQIGKILTLPPDEADAFAKQAEAAERKRGDDGNSVMVIFWIAIALFIILPMIFGRRGGRRYRGGSGPVIIWGPTIGGGGGSGWGSGGSSWGGGSGGGFSGGGGSFGGGGASGGW
ncbi:TPM domain-containing protein [Sphingobium phenoxybenzoativorans]|uniref:TPM domain-containing protein n=1 Tax=Sphingobium phenoxybenzoativorans TaxID=1592790 RepID=UPI0009F5462A|nr:TPM domain-containing protein [Sphingobium phenoxybenzoativorans]